MTVITIEEGQKNLADITDRLLPGEEVLLTKDGVTVAKIVSCRAQPSEPRRLGFMRGTVLYIAPDFDAPMELKPS